MVKVRDGLRTVPERLRTLVTLSLNCVCGASAVSSVTNSSGETAGRRILGGGSVSTGGAERAPRVEARARASLARASRAARAAAATLSARLMRASESARARSAGVESDREATRANESARAAARSESAWARWAEVWTLRTRTREESGRVMIMSSTPKVLPDAYGLSNTTLTMPLSIGVTEATRNPTVSCGKL